MNEFARRVLFEDFDGDERTDIFVLDHGWDASPFPGFRNQLLLNKESGFVDASATHLPDNNADFSHGGAAGDVDKDGDLDIFVSNANINEPYFLINDGTGHFTRDTTRLPAEFLTDVTLPPLSVKLVDLDQDGFVDMGTGNWFGHPNVIYWGNAEGVFSSDSMTALPNPYFYADSHDVPSFEVQDFNGDGKPDLLLGFYGSNLEDGTQILINQGDRTFADETLKRLGGSAHTGPDQWTAVYRFFDFNGDGTIDILPSYPSNSLNLAWLNDGTGHYAPITRNMYNKPDAAFRFSSPYVVDVAGFSAIEWVYGDGLLQMNEGVVTVDPVLTHTGTGSDGRDFITGSICGDNINAGAGDDRIDSNHGDDVLIGGPGNDELNDWSGDERYIFNAADLTGNDLVWDYGGYDTLVFADFGLDRVSSVAQIDGSGLRINFTDGGSIVIFGHFAGTGQAIERLQAGDAYYNIIRDNTFTSGAIETALSQIEVSGNHYDLPILLEPNEVEMSQPEVFDINGDGKQDVVFSSMNPNDVDAEAPLEIWTSNDSGGMELSTDVLIEGGIPTSLRGFRQIIPADFNGDGRLDLFLESNGPEWDCGDGEPYSCWPGGQNSLLLSGEGGKLNNVTTTNLPAFSDYSHGSAVLDFDGDGDMDIWVNNNHTEVSQYYPKSSYLLENDGIGAFTVVADTTLPWLPVLVGHNGILPGIHTEGLDWAYGAWAVAIDADGDGNTDLDLGWNDLFQEYGPPTTFKHSLLLSDGEGRFDSLPVEGAPKPSWADRPTIQHALVYDLNNDGLDDQLLHQTQDYVGPWMQVLISNGDGTFRDETSTRYPFEQIERMSYGFQLHDLDGDGHPDLFNNINFNQLDVRVNDGEGNFRLLSNDWVEMSFSWVVLDVDNDGGTDFLEASNLGLRLHKMNLPYGPELDGTEGDDRLIGGAHDNVYRGLEGNDVLDGGLGNDTLEGGPGNDELHGGKDNDVYVFGVNDLTGTDTILDKHGVDTIRLEGFGLDRLVSATQSEPGDLVLLFDEGLVLTVVQHFNDPNRRIEWLEVEDCKYRIEHDPGFNSAPVEDAISGCVLFESGFE
jgi:Ca2+-binding RTX toxin-like protein